MIKESNRWLELHGTKRDDGRVELECRCSKLGDDGLCTIYETRPLPCVVYPPGGEDCIDTLRVRRTPEQYQRIRDAGDPAFIHEGFDV